MDYRATPAPAGVTVYQASYNKTAIEDVFRRHTFESVLHLGRVGNLSEEMEKRFDLNVIGTQKIMSEGRYPADAGEHGVGQAALSPLSATGHRSLRWSSSMTAIRRRVISPWSALFSFCRRASASRARMSSLFCAWMTRCR